MNSLYSRGSISIGSNGCGVWEVGDVTGAGVVVTDVIKAPDPLREAPVGVEDLDLRLEATNFLKAAADMALDATNKMGAVETVVALALVLLLITVLDMLFRFLAATFWRMFAICAAGLDR